MPNFFKAVWRMFKLAQRRRQLIVPAADFYGV
jgi:hypothetical protein